MKIGTITLITLFCLRAFAFAQDTARLSFDALFPPAKQRAMGLHKLTAVEKAELGSHVEGLLLTAIKAGAKQQAPPLQKQGRQPPAAAKVYPGVGRGHWIKENIDRGAFIVLEDRSLWQVEPLDKINASLWLKISNITVVESTRGSPGYDYLLINTDDGEKAHAKYIGKQ